MMRITPDFRSEIETLLSPYITGSYSEAVKNPVMLLNFLHQHWIISKPEYDIQPDEEKLFHFIVSCSVGSIRTEAKGKSKKEAKSNAAKKLLDLLLGNETWNIDQNKHSASSNMKSVDGRDLDVSVECMSISDTDEVLVIDESNFATRFKGKSTRPKVAKHEINFYEDDLSGIFSFEDSRKSHFNVNYKGCYYKIPNYMSKRGTPEKKTETCSLMDGVEAVQPQCGFEVVCLSDSAVTSAIPSVPESKFSNTSRKSQQSSGVSSVPVKESIQENIWDNANMNGDFFDPFSRVRPPTHPAVHTSTSQPEITEVENEVNSVYEQLTESSGESAASGSVKSTSKKIPKTPFQLLQEKSIRKFKLIPRSSTETTENGFKCTLVIDAYTSVGEGRSKREAKMNAATVLLQQMEDIQLFSDSPGQDI